MTFDESAQSVKKTPNVEEAGILPKLSHEKIGKIQSRIPPAKVDIMRFLRHYDNLRENYPDEFEKVSRKHPAFATNIDAIRGLFHYFEDEKVSDQELIQTVGNYNSYAEEINSLLRQIEQENRESVESTLISSVFGDLPFNEAEFTNEQREELRAFAQELWKELFPESRIDQFVKWSTGQKELEGYQKILLTPANGVESAVMGFINLFKLKTYGELIASIQSVYGLNFQDWCDLWRGMKFVYEQLPTTDKVAPILSIICAIGFLMGGLPRVIEMAQKLGYSAKRISAIKKIFKIRTVSHVLEPMGKAIPINTMLGISLPYIKTEKEN